MKIFESKIIDLRRAAPAKPGKRFISCFVDMIVCCAMALLIFTGARAIAHNTNAYTSAGEIVKEEISYYIDLTEESHIVEYLDKENGVRKDTETMVFENLMRAIYHSYNVLGNAQQPDFTLSDNENVTKFGESSLENDTVAYFYTKYAPENGLLDLKGKTQTEYLFEMYKDVLSSNSTMFVYNFEISEVPIMATQTAYSVLYYLKNGSNDTLGQTGLSNYNAFYDAYAYMLSEGESIIIRSEPYYSSHYTRYYDSYSSQARITNIALLISIFIAYAIGVFLPKMLFKDERSIGRVLMNLGTISNEGEKIKIVNVILKSIIELFGFTFVAFIIYMFPPFNGVFDAMFAPFIGNYSLIALLLIIAMIGLAVNLFSLFTHYKQNLVNMIFQDRVVDLKYLDLGDIDDESEGKSI